MADTPKVGNKAPAISLLDQNGQKVSLADHAGHAVLLYFYPKADTPGCTTQSCALRDVAGDIDDAVIIGISPDAPEKLARFDAKHELGFTLLSDPEHKVAERYGAWGEKKLYGRAYMGVIRSAFLIGPDGRLAAAFPKISPKDTPTKLLKALRELEA